jgi:hypothetical protein
MNFAGLLGVRNDVVTVNNPALSDGQGLQSTTIDHAKSQI